MRYRMFFGWIKTAMIVVIVLAGAAIIVLDSVMMSGAVPAFSTANVTVAAGSLAAAALIFHRDGSFSALGGVPWYYMLGGALGLVITLTVMLGMHALTPATAVSIIDIQRTPQPESPVSKQPAPLFPAVAEQSIRRLLDSTFRLNVRHP